MSNNSALKIGVQLQTHEVAPPEYYKIVKSALSIGVDSLFLWDHLVPFTGKQDDVLVGRVREKGTLSHHDDPSGGDEGEVVTATTRTELDSALALQTKHTAGEA